MYKILEFLEPIEITLYFLHLQLQDEDEVEVVLIIIREVIELIDEVDDEQHHKMLEFFHNEVFEVNDIIDEMKWLFDGVEVDDEELEHQDEMEMEILLEFDETEYKIVFLELQLIMLEGEDDAHILLEVEVQEDLDEEVQEDNELFE